MIAIPSIKGMLGGTAVGAAFSPVDNPDVVEVYNAWDTSRHTYVAARTLVSYETTGGVTTVTCSENPTGFSITGSGDAVIIASGDPEIDGEWTVTAVSGATFSFANPLGSTTSSPVSVSGTAQWKNRKVSAVLGMRGLYSFTQATLANMPQWDATNKRMIYIIGRKHHFSWPSGLRDAISGGDLSIIGVMQQNGSGLRYLIGSSTLPTFAIWNSAASPNLLTVTRSGSAVLTWNDATNNNGNVKLYAYIATASSRAIYVNDMVNARDSNANDGRITFGSETGYIGRNGTNYSAMNHNLLVFATAALDQTYRTSLKAWAEEQMFPTTFG